MRLFEYLKFRCGARGTGRELLRGSVLCVVFGTDVLYAFVERGAALFFFVRGLLHRPRRTKLLTLVPMT